MKSVIFKVKNRWGLHARPCAYIAMVGLQFFPNWEVILVDLRSGRETNAVSIMDMMMLAVRPGSDVEFFSLMPNDAWNKYVEILSALFYTLDEENMVVF